MTNNNQFSIIPEIVITQFCFSMLDWLRADTLKNDSESYLAWLFKPYGQDIVYQKYNYLEQARAIFSRDTEDTNRIRVRLSYSNDKDFTPYLVVSEDEDYEEESGIGESLNLYYSQTDDIDILEQGIYPSVSSFRKAQYRITILSKNVTELSVLFNVFKKLFLTFNSSLQMMGLMNVKIRSGEVENYSPEQQPEPLLQKVIKLNFTYQLNSPILQDIPQFFNGTVNGLPVYKT